MMQTYRWPLVIVISVVALVVAIVLDLPLRPLLTFWFTLICPGIAFIRLFQLREPLPQITLAIALSVALNILVGEFVLYLGVWSPALGLGILIAISLIGAVLQVRQIEYGLPSPRTVSPTLDEQNQDENRQHHGIGPAEQLP